MEYASFFITDKALFGSFPTQTQVEELESTGVRYFVDLTNINESKIVPYSTKYKYINFPIDDRGIPTDKRNFTIFIYKLCDIISTLESTDKLYIHCKGGHGRSGLVVACITCRFFNIPPHIALKHTTLCHSKRETMREIWRTMGSPQTPEQKKFVINTCEKISISKENVLHPCSKHGINIDGVGYFNTVEDVMKNDINLTEISLHIRNETSQICKQALLDTELNYISVEDCDEDINIALMKIRYNNFIL